jgi:hydrogenase-4 component B
MNPLVVFILSFVFILFLIPFLTSKWKWILSIAGIVLLSVFSAIPAFYALSGTKTEIHLTQFPVFGNIPLIIDALSGWFIIIINFTAITGILYGKGYLKNYSDSRNKLSLHLILYLLFHLSMIGVCILQNGLAFLIAWEIMSLSSFLLVIYDHNNQKTLKAGINYFVQMHLSVVFLTMGFLWVYFKTGLISFDAIGVFFNTNFNLWLFLLFFVGFGFKAGFVPFHSWLPHAHPAAPSHISGVMSGVIVKLGIYGIFRIISYLHSDFTLLGEIVLTLSVLTGLYGILNAAVYRDFKQMLAYCTIENIGIIGIGIGIGLIGIGNGNSALYFLGFGGALLHVLNHSLFKSLLFYSAGAVYQQTHTLNMDGLGGLIKTMPKTAVIFLIGAIAIGGLPPLNGFVSEFIIYGGLIEGLTSNNSNQIILFVISLAGLSIIGGLSMLTFTKTFGTLFLGKERKPLQQKPREVSGIMLFPQYFIIAIMLTVAFVPQFYLTVVSKIMFSFLYDNINISPALISNYSTSLFRVSIFSILFIGIIALS